MIFVQREDSPSILDLTDNNSKGNAELQEAISHFSTESDGFSFSVYADNTVKKKLESMFSEKCAFCESCLNIVGYGDIEHFRPKTAIKHIGSKILNYPGYYWLAMSWENLLLSCSRCNRAHKQNYFPLVNELLRNKMHTDQNVEEPLLINPCDEDPEAYLEYTNQGVIKDKDSSKGEISIKIYGLYRPNLTEQRRSLATDIISRITQIKDYLKAINFYRRYPEDPESEHNINADISNIVTVYRSIKDQLQNKEKPYRAMVKQLTNDFMEEYSEQLDQLENMYSMRESLITS